MQKGRLSISVSLLIQDGAAGWNLRHPFAFRLKGAFTYIFHIYGSKAWPKKGLYFTKQLK